MAIQVVTISVEELLGIINVERESAYSNGYIKAKKEMETVKAEPKFTELLRGVKELRQYLMYKDYWAGSISTLSKTAPQLLAEGDRQGHGLIFRRTYIDHAFETGFRFTLPVKKKRVRASSLV
jgi:hypothetical protein